MKDYNKALKLFIELTTIIETLSNKTKDTDKGGCLFNSLDALNKSHEWLMKAKRYRKDKP